MRSAFALFLIFLPALCSGSEPRPLLSGVEVDDKASLTIDGGSLSMTDWSSGDLAIRDMATGKIRRLMVKSGAWESDDFAQDPVLSRDGKMIAYQWYPAGRNPHLRVRSTEPGAMPRVLVKNAEFAYVVPTAWSLDGKSILVHMWRKDYTAQIAWVSLADGSFKVLRSLDWRRPGRPVLSPDGRYIAYSCLDRNDSPDSHVYVLAADGSSESVVIKDAGVNEAPVWLPDGDGLVFVSNRSGKFDLWSIAVSDGKAGGPASMIQADVGKILPTGMTRAGSLYYVRDQGGENIFVANLHEDGKIESPAVAMTTNFAGSNRGPAWSPDGKSIAFKRRNRGTRTGYDVVVRSLESGEERTYVSDRLAGVPDRPAWFRDGKSLLLAMNDNQSRISFDRLNLETGEFTEVLAQDDSYLAMFALSPNDKTVYVTVRDDAKGTGGIASYDLATGVYRRVFTAPGFVNNFALSVDGKTLAVARSVLRQKQWEGRLSVVAAAGGELRDLFVPAESDAEKDIFGGGPMLTWTRDSASIFFTQGTRGWQLMRIQASGGAAEFTGLETAGFRHDIMISPDSKRIAFSHGKYSVKETWVLEHVAPVLKAGK